MTLQELGSLGEFVSAIAVLATLVYLSIQTRLTRKASQESAKFASQQATQAVVGIYSRWRCALMGNPELAGILVKARGGEDLTEKEQLLFSTVFQELFFASVASYQSSLESASVHTESADIDHLIAILNANPRAIDEWRRMRHITSGMSSQFVETVDKLLEENTET